MGTMAMTSNRLRKRPAPLAYFLGFVFVLFIAILVFCYAVTKRTTLVYLDEHGKPVAAHSHSPRH